MPMTRFSEPDSGPTTSATRRRTGTRRGFAGHSSERGATILPAVRLPARMPFRALAWRRAALAARSEERVARGPAESRRGSVRLAWNPPLASDRAPLCRVHVRSKGGPFRSGDVRARCRDPRGLCILRPLVLHRPAKVDAFSRRPRCVRTVARLARSRRSLSPPVRAGLPSTRPNRLR